ncbi:hypothetical protein As57867_007207, partial [Aphanomyces stellatus]
VTYLAKVVDGNAHNFSFGIDYGLDYWPTTGNLLVYLDKAGTATQATIDTKVFETHVKPSVTSKGSVPNITIHTSATRRTRVKSTITTSQGTRQYTIVQSFGFENDQAYSNGGLNQVFTQRTITKTRTTVAFDDGTETSKYFTEDYPLTVAFSRKTYTLGGGRRRLGQQPVNDDDEATVGRVPSAFQLVGFELIASGRAPTPVVYTQSNLTVDHTFRQKLVVDGNKDDVRTGLDSFDTSIVQAAAVRRDTRLNGTNATNTVRLTSSNETGCFSRAVASVNGAYTTFGHGTKCPPFIRSSSSVEGDDDDANN